MAARATIVGAAGFVGGRLRERLGRDGAEVFAPAKGDPALFERDLGVVYYCAGLTADYAQRPFDTVEAHATLVAEMASRATFERFVYTSSTRLYDAADRGGGDMHEDLPLALQPAEPRHIYDLSKALGENIALTQMAGRGGVARLSNVFGWRDGDPGFLSAWLVAARGGRALTLQSSPHIARDYIHVDDVVEALIAIAEAPEPGVVNVAGGALTTNADLAALFAEEGWQVTFTGQANPPAPPNADIARLRALGVSPRGVKDVVRGYLRTEALA
ncbi:NAD(P)-dependent oxidoreductase [Phenylobacterium sp.]|uniref:NAD-dependent epimerase/dehydratase family protein n=1 Tax=Phenylobacterium sp. TaxID=1871053 RepID=UPI00273742CB|nr:SDR family oxidoreductase [Phenylobacterium sp.]MDP3659956.1 SDR family oxidoreductase [Phenylobacterium sp.]